MSTFILEGPSFVPNGTIERCIILLHGFGSDGDDLMGLVPPLETALPKVEQGKTAYFSPHGPLEMDFGGRAWFSDANWTLKDRKGIATAKESLWAYMEEHVFPIVKPEDTYVFGFSQGTMTALFAVPRWPKPIAGLIGHSGRMLWDEELANEGNYHKIPTLLLHGTDDDVVAADESVDACARLQALGFDVEYALISDLAHGINAESLAHVVGFLAEK